MLKTRARRQSIELADGAAFLFKQRPLALDDKAASAARPTTRAPCWPGSRPRFAGEADWTIDGAGSQSQGAGGGAGAGPRQARAAAARGADRADDLAGNFRRAGPARAGGSLARIDAQAAPRRSGRRRTKETELWRTNRRQLSYGDKSIDYPVLEGTRRARRGRYPQALRADGHVHLRSRLHLDRELRKRADLYRRRRGRAAPPRLSDRPAGRAIQLHGSELPAAQRRAAERGRSWTTFQLHDQPPHDAARAADDVLPRLPPRCAPDGDHVRRGRRAVARSTTTAPTSPTPSSARSPATA